MRRRQYNRCVVTYLFRYLTSQFSYCRLRLRQPAEQLFRQPELFYYPAIPFVRLGVHQARTRGVSVFLPFLTRQQKIKVIGQHQHTFRPVNLPAQLIRVKLVNRIELLELYAGTSVQLFKGYNAVDYLYSPLRSSVPVRVNFAC